MDKPIDHVQVWLETSERWWKILLSLFWRTLLPEIETLSYQNPVFKKYAYNFQQFKKIYFLAYSYKINLFISIMPSPDMPFQVWTVITSIVAIITLVRFVPSMNHHVSPYVIWSFLDSRAIWTSPLISSKSDGKFLKELQTKTLTIWVVWRKLASVIVSVKLLLIVLVRIIYWIHLFPLCLFLMWLFKPCLVLQV